MTPPTVVHDPEAHRFKVAMDGASAHTDYRLRDGVMAITHTEVPEAFAGRGVGGALARAALAYARAQGLKVVPLCAFVAGYIAKHPEEQDLLAATT